MNQRDKELIASGIIGAGLGTFVMAFLCGNEIKKLKEKNETSFQLHKQLIDDTCKDMDDHSLTSGEILKRIADRLNFITVSKSI